MLSQKHKNGIINGFCELFENYCRLKIATRYQNNGNVLMSSEKHL